MNNIFNYYYRGWLWVGKELEEMVELQKKEELVPIMLPIIELCLLKVLQPSQKQPPVVPWVVSITLR